MTWNIPNILTLSRIAIIPFFMFAYYNYPTLALVLFIVASVTDFVDGYLARKYQKITNFGKYMDPLADKLLVFSALMMFVQTGVMPTWIAMLVLARELLITGLRTLAAEQKIVMAADLSGKIKTTVQTFSIIFLMTPLAAYTVGPVSLSMAVNYLILAVTIWSGVDYFYRYRHVFSDAGNKKSD